MSDRDRLSRSRHPRSAAGGPGRPRPAPPAPDAGVEASVLLPSGTGGPVPAAPESAVAIFGDSIESAVRYAEILAVDGVARGLIGPREAPRLWERHILNCAAVETLLPASGSVLDLGSGAGLPGIVLAIMRPEIEFTLLDSLLRRCAFLEACTRELRLQNTTVIRGRAEDYAGVAVWDAVVARAVAPLDRLVGWAMPILRPGGLLLAMKGEGAAAELASAMKHLERAGAIAPRVVIAAQHDAQATVIMATRSGGPR